LEINIFVVLKAKRKYSKFLHKIIVTFALIIEQDFVLNETKKSREEFSSLKINADEF
jgi:hypothetical protein